MPLPEAPSYWTFRPQNLSPTPLEEGTNKKKTDTTERDKMNK